jgi:Transposase zinc-ribbon domain
MSTNILKITKQYDTQAKCLSYLKSLRWGKTVKCPNCEFEKLLKNALQHEKGLLYWKAKSTQNVKEVAYGK